jgi:hypothetical protein
MRERTKQPLLLAVILLGIILGAAAAMAFPQRMDHPCTAALVGAADGESSSSDC